MNKYNIEGGIDFFAELYKSLDIEEDEENTENDNKCLITNEILTDKFISLKCGHKFNYVPLYYDILNHKKKFNFMESKKGKLAINEIRCPYCRTKQNELLPYYPEFGLEKINGVNFYDPTIKQSQHYYNSLSNKCEFLTLNKNYNPNETETPENQQYLQLCMYNGSKINILNDKNPYEPFTFGDTKCYCYSHKKQMIKKYKKEQKEKEEQTAKEEKQMEKQKAKEEKQMEKQKAKEEKQMEKQKAKELKKLLKTQTGENIVLGPITVSQGCHQILKTGLNKGKQCGCKIVSDNLCKRHSKNNIVN